jgi:flagellar hook-associated protein 3 FlgL
MTRVSENSSTASLKYALNKTKERVEDLQIKGSTLKSINKPSDNPVSNVEAMAITSATNDNLQYLKNADFALLNLSVSEKSIEELTDIMIKAKEIAISQSSDFFNADIRKNVANEIKQLYNQSLAIANKKVGLKHIFSGTSTLTVPFNSYGEYQGDQGRISLEVSRNFFVPINLTGEEVFFSTKDSSKDDGPLDKLNEFKDSAIKNID